MAFCCTLRIRITFSFVDSKDKPGLNAPCTFISELPVSQDDKTSMPQTSLPFLERRRGTIPESIPSSLAMSFATGTVPTSLQHHVLQSDQCHLPATPLSAPSHSIGMLASLKTRDKQPFLYLTVTHETLLYLVHCTGKEKTQEHNGTLLSKNAEIITEKIPETSVWRTHLCKSTGILMLPCLISPQSALTLRSLQQTAHLYLISKFPLFHILS